jgi:hypothetical protein
MTRQTEAPGRPPERAWAEEVVRAIPLPTPLHLRALIQAVAHHIGTPLHIVEVDACTLNGALELHQGVTAICVPTGAAERHRRFMICRGLARALYRAPGARDGHMDLSQPLEREVEFAAMALAQRLYRAQHPRPDTSA